jgi:hypothetical protein
MLIRPVSFDEYLIYPCTDTGHPNYLCKKSDGGRWDVKTSFGEDVLFAIPDLGVCFEWISLKIKEPFTY